MPFLPVHSLAAGCSQLGWNRHHYPVGCIQVTEAHCMARLLQASAKHKPGCQPLKRPRRKGCQWMTGTHGAVLWPLESIEQSMKQCKTVEEVVNTSEKVLHFLYSFFCEHCSFCCNSVGDQKRRTKNANSLPLVSVSQQLPYKCGSRQVSNICFNIPSRFVWAGTLTSTQQAKIECTARP